MIFKRLYRFLYNILLKSPDFEFCGINLPTFLRELTYFGVQLKEAFMTLKKAQSSLSIPPEMPPILTQITKALDDFDLVALEHEVALLSGLNLTGVLKDDVERIKQAVAIMDFDSTAEIINGLYASPGHRLQ